MRRPRQAPPTPGALPGGAPRAASAQNLARTQSPSQNLARVPSAAQPQSPARARDAARALAGVRALGPMRWMDAAPARQARTAAGRGGLRAGLRDDRPAAREARPRRLMDEKSRHQANRRAEPGGGESIVPVHPGIARSDAGQNPSTPSGYDRRWRHARPERPGPEWMARCYQESSHDESSN
jgi:hypothetical protein